jgi:Tol biopolymer transport system component
MTGIPAGLAAATADRYRIERELGQGGMATVYLAEDLKHHRQVAVKVLRPELAATLGPERFLREIETTAGLRHPNILPLYDSGAAAGLLYYVMPFVEGETLRDRLHREKQLPLEDALQIAREVADALSYAHGRGVIHRDIKPENILLERGHAVVADFGIARAVSTAGGGQLTEPGMAVGTVLYMSPEQAAGEGDVDGRSDLYALGCVLYEMLAGQPPFTGPTAESIARQHLLAAPPPITQLRPTAPAQVSAALTRALAKSPADRFGTPAEFIAALDKPVEPARTPPPSGRRVPRLVPAVITLAILTGVAALIWSREWLAAAHRGPAPVTLRQVTISQAVEEYPALSADGRRLVFSRDVAGRRQLFLRELPDGPERQLTHGAYDNIQAAWTPDQRAVLFVRASDPLARLQPGDVFGEFAGGDIWRRELESGAEERLVEDAYDPAVAPGGRRIAFDASRSGTRRIWIADERGRNAQQVSLDSSEAVSHVVPRWSPDGKRIAYQEIEHTRFDIRVVDVATRASVAVTDDAFQDVNPVWDGSGRGIYFSSYRAGGMNVWREPVAGDGKPTGPPAQITTGAGQDVQLSAPSADGRLAFTVLQLNADLWRLPVDPATGRPRGAPEPVVATTREDSRGAWSPDSRFVAFNSDRAGDMNIWIHSLADGTDRQITRGPGGDYQPRWSPDGRRLAFFSARGGNADIWVVELADGRLTQLTTSPWLDINPSFSPDGGRIAFQSDRQGRMEVWVMNADGTGQRQLSTVGSGGHFEVWAADGRSLLFRPTSGGMSAARLTVADGRLAPVGVRGGSHMSFAPGEALVADVIEHRQVWVSPVGGAPYMVFAFEDPDIRIDYPVWSPDGRWLLFDRLKPEGGDIWLLEQSRAAH